MTGPDWLILAVFPVLGWLLREVYTLRGNELKHLQDSVDRVEDKLDRHLEWHADATRRS